MTCCVVAMMPPTDWSVGEFQASKFVPVGPYGAGEGFIPVVSPVVSSELLPEVSDTCTVPRTVPATWS